MNKQFEYNILISANCLSTLEEKDLNSKLVASLYDIDTDEKISDGDNENFEILDYNFTIVSNDRESLDLFIQNAIKEVIEEIVVNTDYDMSLLDPVLFSNIIVDSDLIITEYQIGRIYALAEIYFKIMKKPTIYGSLMECIANYDIQTYK